MNDPAAPVFDAHLHIIDPRFPLVPNRGYLPPAYGVDDYRRQVANLPLVGGAVVSGSFQAFDQDYLLAALSALGAGFVGVTQLPASVSDAEIQRLSAGGVRALRFNVRRGGSADLAELEPFARRVHELAGWHVELYVDAAEINDALYATLVSLPAVSIDHLGLSRRGLPRLYQLVEAGVKVKATGFSRVDFEVGEALRRIAEINPQALMFGTDLPGTRAPRPYSADDMKLLLDSLGDSLARLALCENARAFYHQDYAPGA